jgi:aspartate oxidase
MTGAAIHNALLETVRAHGDRITLLPNHMAVDLLTTAKYGGPNSVFGAYVFDQKTGEMKTITARAVIIATGGAGKVYLYTSNPDVATGRTNAQKSFMMCLRDGATRVPKISAALIVTGIRVCVNRSTLPAIPRRRCVCRGITFLRMLRWR